MTDETYQDEEAPQTTTASKASADSKKKTLLNKAVNNDMPGDVRVILRSMFLSSYYTLDHIKQETKPQGLYALNRESWLDIQRTLIPFTNKLLLPPSILVPLCCFIPAMLLEFFLWFHTVMVGEDGGYMIYYMIGWAFVTVALMVALSQYAYQTNRQVDRELNAVISSALNAEGYATEFIDGTSSNIFRTRVLRLRPVTPDAITAAGATAEDRQAPLKEKDSAYATFEFVLTALLIAVITSLLSVYHSVY